MMESKEPYLVVRSMDPDESTYLVEATSGAQAWELVNNGKGTPIGPSIFTRPADGNVQL